jgi:hypothetical protein
MGTPRGSSKIAAELKTGVGPTKGRLYPAPFQKGLAVSDAAASGMRMPSGEPHVVHYPGGAGCGLAAAENLRNPADALTSPQIQHREMSRRGLGLEKVAFGPQQEPGFPQGAPGSSLCGCRANRPTAGRSAAASAAARMEDLQMQSDAPRGPGGAGQAAALCSSDGSRSAPSHGPGSLPPTLVLAIKLLTMSVAYERRSWRSQLEKGV